MWGRPRGFQWVSESSWWLRDHVSMSPGFLRAIFRTAQKIPASVVSTCLDIPAAAPILLALQASPSLGPALDPVSRSFQHPSCLSGLKFHLKLQVSKGTYYRALTFARRGLLPPLSLLLNLRVQLNLWDGISIWLGHKHVTWCICFLTIWPLLPGMVVLRLGCELESPRGISKSLIPWPYQRPKYFFEFPVISMGSQSENHSSQWSVLLSTPFLLVANSYWSDKT